MHLSLECKPVAQSYRTFYKYPRTTTVGCVRCFKHNTIGVSTTTAHQRLNSLKDEKLMASSLVTRIDVDDVEISICTSQDVNEQNGNNVEQEEDSVGVRVAIAMLNFYKTTISPLLPPACRFQPTCSAYSMDAYRKFGVAKGTILTAWRLARCNPWGGSGYDPVKWPPPGLEHLFP